LNHRPLGYEPRKTIARLCFSMTYLSLDPRFCTLFRPVLFHVCSTSCSTFWLYTRARLLPPLLRLASGKFARAPCSERLALHPTPPRTSEGEGAIAFGLTASASRVGGIGNMSVIGIYQQPQRPTARLEYYVSYWLHYGATGTSFESPNCLWCPWRDCIRGNSNSRAEHSARNSSSS
jgi:hypothetical protein